MAEATLAELAAGLDEQQHVRRANVSARIDALLDPGSADRILVLHGPGGIGKSAELREAGRCARRKGYEVAWLSGPRLSEAAILEEELSRSVPSGREPLAILLDEIDSLGAALHSVGAWIGTLPASTRVIVAGRARPDRGWIGDGLQPIAASCRLAPLTDREAHELLRGLGVVDSDRAHAVARWAAGSPLALVLAARAPDELAAGMLGPEAVEDLIERVAGTAVDGSDRELLEAASSTWSVDESLLAAVLPRRDGSHCLRRLVDLDFVERRADRAVVHPLVARAVVERLQVEEPRRARSLRMRAASHLRDRATDGDAAALADLAGLLRDRDLRDGLGPAFSERFYADRIRASDREPLGARIADERQLPWSALEPWLHPPANECFVVRLRSGQCVGIGAVFAAGTPGARADGLSAPLLEFVDRLEQPERAVVSPFGLTFAGPDVDRAGLTRFMNAIAMMRCGVPNPRYDIVNDVGWTARERDVAAGYGYEEVPALRREIGACEVRTWFADSGSAGLAGLVYRAIAAENGIEVPAGSGWPDVVLAALEDFYDDRALARLPVAAHGHSRADAANLVRERVRAIVNRALAHEPQLRAIIDARYLTPSQSHDAAMRAAFESRSSYFRKLRRAREAIVASSSRPRGPHGGVSPRHP